MVNFAEIPQIESLNGDSANLYLFNYHDEEKVHLNEFFLQKYQCSPIFLENLNIGIISLTTEDKIILENEYKQLYERLHSSRHYSTLPSGESLMVKMIHSTNQFEYVLPSNIVNVSALWENGVTGTGTKIAIIDSGIDATHPDFNTINIQESFVTTEYGYSTEESYEDWHGHGTHVAGIAAANSLYYPGIAYNAELVNLKVADEFGSATNAGLIAAIDRAIEENVDVISISLGFAVSTPWDADDLLTTAVNSAVDQGVSVVVAAGNEATDPVPFTTINTPASASKVITVGASNGSKDVLSFSSQGPSLDFRVDPDVVAPGYQIVGPLASQSVIESAYNALVGVTLSDYVILSGTSMAAPIVSGAVALLKQQFPDASPHAIRAALQESATDLGGNETVYSQGSGLINIGIASSLLAQTKEISGYDLISSSPRADGQEIDFFQPFTFPGDQAKITLSFVTGKGGTVAWEVSESLQQFLRSDLSPNVLATSGYFEKQLTLEIPYNAPIGEYHGNFVFNFEEKNHTIPINFTIQSPLQKIYWDIYNTGIDDSFYYNYNQLNELLQDNRIDVNDYNTTLSWSDLSQNNILVLTDLEFPLSNREVEFIKEFHARNGSLVLVTSFFPYFNPDPYEKLSAALDLPINFSNRVDLIEYSDDGRDRIPNPQTIAVNKLVFSPNNPFFEGVTEIPTLGGSMFIGNITDSRLTHYVAEDNQMNNTGILLAGLEPTGKGKILILGSESWLYPSYMLNSSGQMFLSNVLNWLVVDQPIANIRYINTSNSLETAVYFPIVQNYSLSVTLYNCTEINNINVPYNNTKHFNYLNYKLC